MKIKTKKQLNLPQLIEWGFEQKELPPLFYGSREGSLVQFTPGGWVNITGIETTDTFTVTTEEEITEDTVFEYLINVYRGNGTFMELDTNECINDYNVANLTEVHAYIDGEFKLIWHDGKLVE